MGGTYVVRFEDTDQARSTEASITQILEGLEWLGLAPDEGGTQGGPYGPYRQTERLSLYHEHLQQLVKSGHAYPCYCSDEELRAKREAAQARGEVPRYDGKCRKASAEDVRRWEAEGRRPAYRFKLPLMSTRVEDAIRGLVHFSNMALGDFVILKSDGTPAYNFAVVVDDHHMKITHVIRGEDHLSNTPRQLFLYEAFGWTPPQFAHLPMILGPDRALLSKRHGAVSVLEYRDQGFLPEAVVNYTALLGWSHPSGKELLTREEMIEGFSLERVSKHAAVFDLAKMTWMNSQYLRRMAAADLAARLVPFVPPHWSADRGWLERAAEVVKASMEKLTDFTRSLKGVKDTGASDPQAVQVLEDPSVRPTLAGARDALAHVSPFEEVQVKEALAAASQAMGKKGKAFLLPLRCALTGQLHGPELTKLIPLIGREEVLNRLARWSSPHDA